MPDLRYAAAAAFCAALATPFAVAADEQPLTAQQQRMKSCNAEASGKQMKGDERRSFMSQCLKADKGGKPLTAQQEKMATCNRTASDRQLKGDERRAYMKDCLSAKQAVKPSAATGR